MSATPPPAETPRIARGLGGVLMLAVPIVSIAIVGSIYAVLFGLGMEGHEATGDHVQLTYQGCPEALPVLEARVRAMGLPEVATQVDGELLRLQARLPADEAVAQAIPQDLARVGTFTLHPEEPEAEPLATRDDVAAVHLSLAFFDIPGVTVQLRPEVAKTVYEHMATHPDGTLALSVDGQHLRSQRNMPPESQGHFTVDLEGASDRDRLNYNAATAIILEHGPLPCPVRLHTVRPMDEVATPIASD